MTASHGKSLDGVCGKCGRFKTASEAHACPAPKAGALALAYLGPEGPPRTYRPDGAMEYREMREAQRALDDLRALLAERDALRAALEQLDMWRLQVTEATDGRALEMLEREHRRDEMGSLVRAVLAATQPEGGAK